MCFYGSLELHLEIICPALLQGLLTSRSQLVKLKIYLIKLVGHLMDLVSSLMPLTLWYLEFLKMCAPIDHPFYKAVFNTQMFINFVEQRSFSYSMDTTLAFFDECTKKVILLASLPEVISIVCSYAKTPRQRLSSHWRNVRSMCST